MREGRDEWMRFNRARNCFYCGVAFRGSGVKRQAPAAKTRDHVVPASRGASLRGNVVAACAWCNGLKASRTLEGFRKYLASLAAEWDGKFAAESGHRGPPLWFGPVTVEWETCRDEFDRRVALKADRG